MVSSGSEEATRAGVEVLERGGNAVDAAVATALALGVADPGGSGMGGMTYILVHMNDGRAVAIDGTAPVPIAINPVELEELRAQDRLIGHKTVAVPATLAALDHALSRYGTMSFEEVVQPAIKIADRGYLLTSHHITWLSNYLEPILASDHLRFMVLEDGTSIGNIGDRYYQTALGATLRRIAADGPESFYRGSIADEIVADMQRNGGYLREVDLLQLRVRELAPLRSRYRGREVISYPPPGSGAQVVEALNILEQFPSSLLDSDSTDRLHVLTEAFRIARSDHIKNSPNPNLIVGGTDLPHTSREFAAARAKLITLGQALPQDGLTMQLPYFSLADNTTHVSVADELGNSAALTQTLGRQYGAKVAHPELGFPYNCMLQTFDFSDPSSPGFPLPRGRYPTDMAPTIVLENGRFRCALGSAGSERVPPLVTLTVSNLVDRDMGVREAVLAPRVMWGGTTEPKLYLEIRSPITHSDADRLTEAGFGDVYRLLHPPRYIDLNFFGGVNIVAYDAKTEEYVGVGDPRRSGYAMGPKEVRGKTEEAR